MIPKKRERSRSIGTFQRLPCHVHSVVQLIQMNWTTAEESVGKRMEIYEKLVLANDDFVQDAMERQVLDTASRFYGGVADPANGLAWPSHGGTPKEMAAWACTLINEDSRFYHHEELLHRLELAAEFMLRSQHADGSISPPWTNLHSPPDTAFVVSGLAQVYELLNAHAAVYEQIRKAAADIRRFLERTIPVLQTGGCHTPNHRWVIASALGFMFKLTGRAKLKERAEQWLAEGLDCTEDGEWTERSNGIYNAVSDLVLYYAAELLGRPELLEPVRRNLRMMAYLIHPGGDVVTDYSGRQDFGRQSDLSGFFLILKLMEERDRDPLFAALADLAGEALGQPGMLPNNALIGYLRYPELRRRKVEPGPLPDRYKVVINGGFPRERYLQAMEAAGHGGRIYHSRLHPDFGAPVARQREGKTSVTVMAEANSFFALRHGEARLLGVQIGTSFGPGFVKFQTLERLERLGQGYRLRAEEYKGYYGPVPARDLPAAAGEAVSPWYLLPHHLREVTHEQKHEVELELAETGQGWSLRLCCRLPEVLMTQVSFIFGSEGAWFGEGVAPAGEGTYFWKDGRVRYSSGSDWIELEGGGHEHSAKELNNLSYPPDCRTLLVNLLTPYDRTFQLRLSPAQE